MTHFDLSETTKHELLARAANELHSACAGWRLRQRCVDEHDRQVFNPHPECLAAQQRYVVFLLNHGLIGDVLPNT